jgi:hypothetical protein
MVRNHFKLLKDCNLCVILKVEDALPSKRCPWTSQISFHSFFYNLQHKHFDNMGRELRGIENCFF